MARIRHEVYLRNDIVNVLRAVDKANASLSAHLPVQEVAVYRAGFIAAIESVAAAFDLDVTPQRPAHGDARLPQLRTLLLEAGARQALEDGR